jgi:hypothetical protein
VAASPSLHGVISLAEMLLRKKTGMVEHLVAFDHAGRLVVKSSDVW